MLFLLHQKKKDKNTKKINEEFIGFSREIIIQNHGNSLFIQALRDIDCSYKIAKNENINIKIFFIPKNYYVLNQYRKSVIKNYFQPDNIIYYLKLLNLVLNKYKLSEDLKNIIITMYIESSKLIWEFTKFKININTTKIEYIYNWWSFIIPNKYITNNMIICTNPYLTIKCH